MIVNLGDSVTFDFLTHSPSTGGISDADGTPTCEVFEDATDTPVLSPTVTKRTSKTGNYRATVAVTDANGFEVGKSYNVVCSATVGGISAKDVRTFKVDVLLRPTGSVVTDAGNSVSQFKTDLSFTKTDLFKDALILFITGANVSSQVKKIGGYDGTLKVLSLASGQVLTDVPSNGDKFVILTF